MLHPGEAETRLLPLAQPPVVLGRQLRAGPGPPGRPLLRVEEERRERPPEGARANGAAEMLASNARAEGGLRALVPGSDAYVEELEVLRRVLRTMNLGDRARRHPPRVEAWRLGNPTLARLAPSLCDGARLATKRPTISSVVATPPPLGAFIGRELAAGVRDRQAATSLGPL